MTWEADGVLSLVLVDPEGKPLPDWHPGAHVDLCLPSGVIRQYSLCGDPDDPTYYRVAVLQEQSSRGGSDFVHRQVRPGQRLQVRGPRNNFAFHASDRYLFVAGGIGITPLLPMVAAAARSRAEWRLLYGGRHRASMAFLDELAGYGGSVVVSPQDEAGLMDLDGWLARPQPGVQVYCCGPEPLLAAVENLCRSWPDGTLQVERFAPRAGNEYAIESERDFDVVCSQSGARVKVRPGCSILESLRNAGLDLPSSCEEGICGTCETAVLEGSVDHRDSILSDAERAANDTMMICVSRAQSPVLVLDL
ncbi:MAG: oxidoreductase [Jatrophihabitans sp.]|nr:MAG: oxidoreductase [Jatrophihabitans sp.]